MPSTCTALSSVSLPPPREAGPGPTQARSPGACPLVLTLLISPLPSPLPLHHHVPAHLPSPHPSLQHAPSLPASPRLRLFRPSGGREGRRLGQAEGRAGEFERPGPAPLRGRPAMLITLCYLYLWARWGRRPAALVRITVQRLRASRCSFTFCVAAARPPEASVCLSRGGRVFCVGESQVGGARRGGARGGGAYGAGQQR